MKTNCILQSVIMLFFVFTATAQQGINYKAIINTENGDILANTLVAVQFTILENGTTTVFQEIHNPITDDNGIIIVNIGEGTLINGDFITIDWGSAPYFLKIEIDTGEGLTDMGTTEFKAVPYALHSNKADDLSNPITESQNLTDVVALGNSANSQIKDITDPTEAQDAATKAYVDQLLSRIEQIENNIDKDYDGFTVAQGDCDDFNPEIYPGAYDICNDGIDQDCDGKDNNCTVTDHDGNEYQTVQIGTQEWMAENLKVKHYADGTPISLVYDNSAWTSLDIHDKAYCWYNNEESYSETYGALYTLAAATNGSGTMYGWGVQGVCPDGWNLPGNAEWNELAYFLEGTNVAGGKLKEEGTIHWISPNIGATNETGFTALPGGIRWTDGTFERMGIASYYWTATEYTDNQAYIIFLWNSEQELYMGDYFYKAQGLSVRCVKD